MTKQKKKPSKDETMQRRLWTLTEPQGPGSIDEEFAWIIEGESGLLADAIDYCLGKPERYEWIGHVFRQADEEAATVEERMFIRQAWPKVCELFDTAWELSDAHEAFYRLYGHQTWQHKRREQRMAENLTRVAHLHRCLEM